MQNPRIYSISIFFPRKIFVTKNNTFELIHVKGNHAAGISTLTARYIIVKMCLLHFIEFAKKIYDKLPITNDLSNGSMDLNF